MSIQARKGTVRLELLSRANTLSSVVSKQAHKDTVKNYLLERMHFQK